MSNDYKVTLKTYLKDNGVYQEVDYMGHIIKEFTDVMAIQRDEKIREALINLGWTPPKDDDSSVG